MKKFEVWLLGIIIVFIIAVVSIPRIFIDIDGPKNIDVEILPSGSPHFEVFLTLYETDLALNSNIEYISIDLEKVNHPNYIDSIIRLMEKFCQENNYQLLKYNHEELIEKGYITNIYFEKGILISFEDLKLDTHPVVIRGSKWRSGLGAFGADYTVESGMFSNPTNQWDNNWRIINTTNEWIS